MDDLRLGLRLMLALTLVGCGGGTTGQHVNSTSPDLAVVHDFAMGGNNPGDMAQGNPGDDGGGGGGGGDMAMCKPPSTLHPPQMGKPSIYCPFSGMNGGKAIYCMQGMQHCCEPSQGTAMCDPIATACPAGNTDWQCEDPTDCANGQHCCGSGTVVIAPPGCQNFGSKFTGTHCAASCAANEITMCTSDGECGGKTCTPFETKGNQVGACL
jgi:hypothetical protein